VENFGGRVNLERIVDEKPFAENRLRKGVGKKQSAEIFWRESSVKSNLPKIVCGEVLAKNNPRQSFGENRWREAICQKSSAEKCWRRVVGDMENLETGMFRCLAVNGIPSVGCFSVSLGLRKWLRL
jgi:hypothetical protein